MSGASRLLRDVRHAIRLLRNSPGLSAVAIVTIALAIGANTAMFSFVNGLLLSPLPYPESNRIVRVLERVGGNKLKAAKILGVGRNTIYKALSGLKLEKPNVSAQSVRFGTSAIWSR